MGDMIRKMKEGWRHFEASKPGRRFQDRYRRRQENEHGWLDPGRIFYVSGGIALAGGSLVLGALPGPGVLTFFLGLGMVAGEFRPVARLLDWVELRARDLGRWVGGVWRSSAAGKVLIILTATTMVAAAIYLAYLFFFGG